MSLFRKKKAQPEPGFTRDKALALTPAPNPEVTEETGNEGPLRLVYQVRFTPWYGRLAGRLGAWDNRPMTKRLELDEMGAAVWRLIDGKHTVQDIISRVATDYSLLDREAEASVTAFLRELGKRSLVAMR